MLQPLPIVTNAAAATSSDEMRIRRPYAEVIPPPSSQVKYG